MIVGPNLGPKRFLTWRRRRVAAKSAHAPNLQCPLLRAKRTFRAGIKHCLGVLAQDLQPGLLETFRDELHRLGYVEPGNIRMEVRNAAGINEWLATLANDLVRLKVDVILAVNTPAAQAEAGQQDYSRCDYARGRPSKIRARPPVSLVPVGTSRA
jgi:hypothetical protein